MFLRCFCVSKALALESESGVQADFCLLEGVRNGQAIGPVLETPTCCPGFATVVVLPQSSTHIPKHVEGKYRMPTQGVTTHASSRPSCPPIVPECSFHHGVRNLAQDPAPSQESSCSRPSFYRQYFRPRPPIYKRGTTLGENASPYFHILPEISPNVTDVDYEPEVEVDWNWPESAMDFNAGTGKTVGGPCKLTASIDIAIDSIASVSDRKVKPGRVVIDGTDELTLHLN
eukprot:gene5493-5547_t